MHIAPIPNDSAVLIKLVEKPGSTTGNPGASEMYSGVCAPRFLDLDSLKIQFNQSSNP